MDAPDPVTKSTLFKGYREDIRIWKATVCYSVRSQLDFFMAINRLPVIIVSLPPLHIFMPLGKK